MAYDVVRIYDFDWWDFVGVDFIGFILVVVVYVNLFCKDIKLIFLYIFNVKEVKFYS